MCELCYIFQTLSWTDSIKPGLLFSNFVVSLYFRRIFFFRLFSLFYSLLETPNSWFLQDLRQNGVGRVFERVNMMQENNWLIRLNDKAILKESLHNQKLHRVLFVRVTLLDYISGAFVKSRATWCPRGLGTVGLMSRDLHLGEADVGALFIE